MRCPLCGVRKARRACPARGGQICSVCCGSKRLVEIACPPDCAYLASAREHPPAIQVRRHEQDLGHMAPVVRDFSSLQGDLFFLLAAAILGDTPADLQSLLDEDVAEAAAALASTLETAARGVIYEHQPATRPATRLMGAFKALLDDAAKAAGSRVEREAVLVLRRIEEAARVAPQSRAFIERLGRVIRLPDRGIETASPEGPPEPGRLIVP